MTKTRLRASLAIGTALAAMVGGSSALAGTCTVDANTNAYSCASPADSKNDTTQTLNLTTGLSSGSTIAGFGIDTSTKGGAALVIIGSGSFTDDHKSTITGKTFGVTANNTGAGALTIATNGTVTGQTDTGIDATTGSTSTGLTINAGTVNGFTWGIRAFNNGGGALSVTATGLVTGTNYYGVKARTNSAATDLTVNLASVTGGGFVGILADNRGTGATSLTVTGTATSTQGTAVDAYNTVNSTGDMTVTVANASGANVGVIADQRGSGALTVNSIGQIDGGGGDAIKASAGNQAKSLTVNVAQASGTRGIYAQNNGLGTTTVTASGLVTGTTGNGIQAYNQLTTATGDITVNADSVTGGVNGIAVKNFGTGSIAIKATGLATGDGAGGSASLAGIKAVNYAGSKDLTIAAAATKGNNGIYAKNSGTGVLTITTTGSTTGIAHGIYAKSDATSSGVSVTTGSVTTPAAVSASAGQGIEAINLGSGLTSVIANGTVESTGGNGIDVRNAATSAGSIVVNAGTVTGGNNGIYAYNKGSGALQVTATGSVIGNKHSGVVAANSNAAATDLTVALASVTGFGYFGVTATNSGTGATSLTVTGTATGATGGEGVRYAAGVSNTSNATGDVTVTVATAKSPGGGIFAQQNGSGALIVTSTGEVTGVANNGIYALANTGAKSLTVSAAQVLGKTGIFAKNDGLGATMVTASGLVTGTGGDGIYATNSAGHLAPLIVTVTGASVTGSTNGINALNKGLGTTTVEASGLVTGTTGSGIQASNFLTTATGDITVSAASVTGGVSGIYAQNHGTGSIAITATGLATGNGTYLGQAGIRALNLAGSKDLTIAAAATTGNDGINAKNSGTGVLAITTTGTTTGTQRGICALGDTTSSGVSVTTGSVTTAATVRAADAAGIQVINNGSGPTSVTANGTVASTNSTGIDVSNAATSRGNIVVKVNADTVTGNFYGINAYNNGSGTLKVTATGVITGTNYAGVYAANYGGKGTDLTVELDSVNGGSDGVVAKNRGTGATSLTVTGTATSTNKSGGTGVFASNTSNSTGDVTVTVANTSGKSNGIIGYQNGSGALTVISAVEVRAKDGSAIYASAGDQAKSLTVSAAKVSGVSGIDARNSGVGATTVTATDQIIGTGGDGIHVTTGITDDPRSTGVLTVTAANVTGAINGISARNNGTGTTTITAKGTVIGEEIGFDPEIRQSINSYGISAATSGPVVITVASGGAVSGKTAGIGLAGAGPATIDNQGGIANVSNAVTDVAISQNFACRSEAMANATR